MSFSRECACALSVFRRAVSSRFGQPPFAARSDGMAVGVRTFRTFSGGPAETAPVAAVAGVFEGDCHVVFDFQSVCRFAGGLGLCLLLCVSDRLLCGIKGWCLWLSRLSVLWGTGFGQHGLGNQTSARSPADCCPATSRSRNPPELSGRHAQVPWRLPVMK